jgi:hypothetical protein
VIPAQMIKGHTEAGMHGGVPSGAHVHHVTVAIFDEKSCERIADAVVKSAGFRVGLAGTEKVLEP